MKLRLTSACLFSLWAFNASAAVPSNGIPLQFQGNNTPFFTITLTGQALKGPVTARFDTGASTFILPQGCLNPNSSQYRVINANVMDEWNKPAKLVSGPITLTSANGTKYTVNDFQFFVTPENTCDSSNFINFGAGSSLFYSTTHGICAMSFLNAYAYTNKSEAPFGFTLYTNNAASNTPYLTLGPITGLKPIQKLTRTAPRSCGGLNNIVGFNGASPYNEATLKGVTLTIGNQGVTLPKLTAMLDTGGGMTIVSDNEQGTLSKKLAHKHLVSACPSNIGWLKDCQCLEPGTPIKVSFRQHSYSYSATSPSSQQSQALAICPLWNRNSPTPYILPNGVNLGFEFFNSMQSVGFDLHNGVIRAH